MSPSIRKYYSIFIILMYLCKSFPPIKIVSHGDVIFTSWSKDYPEIVSRSPTAIFTTDANYIFSWALSLTHSLSLSLRHLACFPFFPFEYKYYISAYCQLLRFWQWTSADIQTSCLIWEPAYNTIYNNCIETGELYLSNDQPCFIRRKLKA